MNPPAQSYLADALAHAREGSGKGPGEDDTDWARRTLATYMAVLGAFRAVGSIDQDDEHDWTNRMLVALGQEPIEPLPPGFSGARIISIRRADEVPVPPSVPELVRVVAAQEPPVVTPAGGRFQLLSVEIYDSQLAVNWRLSPLPNYEEINADELAAFDQDTEGLPEAERQMRRQRHLHSLAHRHERVGVKDDLGTPYGGRGGGSHGGRDEKFGRSTFMPAPPAEARRLTVLWGELTQAVDLGS